MRKESFSLKPGDIVKHEEAPCEVICSWPEKDLIVIMNKRTLIIGYLSPKEVEFVRRPLKER